MNGNKKGYMLINAGAETRKAFEAGLHGDASATFKSKEMLLHLSPETEPLFVYKNSPVQLDASYVFIRLRGTDSHFCGILSEYLACKGIPSNDPIHLSYPFSAEKISQMLLLTLGGIRIPETFIFREESFFSNIEYLRAQLVFPLIYKLDGSKGRNVQLINTFKELETSVASKHPHRLALVQPFIQNTFDTRTLVFKNTILGAISRTRTEGYLNNIAQGAKPAAFTLSELEQETVIKAAKACRIDFAGVDMIHTPEGPVVLEVNKSPQVGGFEAVHQFRVFTRLAELIRDEAAQ